MFISRSTRLYQYLIHLYRMFDLQRNVLCTINASMFALSLFCSLQEITNTWRSMLIIKTVVKNKPLASKDLFVFRGRKARFTSVLGIFCDRNKIAVTKTRATAPTILARQDLIIFRVFSVCTEITLNRQNNLNGL